MGSSYLAASIHSGITQQTVQTRIEMCWILWDFAVDRLFLKLPVSYAKKLKRSHKWLCWAVCLFTLMCFFMGVCAVQVVCRRPLVFAQQHYNQFQAAQSCKSGYFPLQLEELWLLLTLLWIMALTWCKKKCLETLQTSVYILHIILNGFPCV